MNRSETLISLLKDKVVPAIGCTEPIAVALAVAKAHEILGYFPTKITIALSVNVLKNAMGVGIPGTDMVGLPIAVALGLVAGHSEYWLEVLKDVDESAIKKARDVISKNMISFEKADTNEKLYIEVLCQHADSYSKVIIAQTHTNFVLLEHNGTELLNKIHNNTTNNSQPPKPKSLDFKFSDIYEFATTCEIDEIKFILDSATVNKEAAKIGMNGDYGLGFNKVYRKNIENGILAEDAVTYALTLTTAAIDARMGGAKATVYSNSGSGDQGIAVTLPVLAYSETSHASQEQLIRALTLSHLIAIYIKQKLGVLSAFCGITTASIAAACGITYLMGGNLEQIGLAVKNFAAGIVGMICDGAKNSCALKVSAGVFCAFNAALLAIENIAPNETEGIVHSDVEATIDNIVKIGKVGMKDMDSLILDIMLDK